MLKGTRSKLWNFWKGNVIRLFELATTLDIHIWTLYLWINCGIWYVPLCELHCFIFIPKSAKMFGWLLLSLFRTHTCVCAWTLRINEPFHLVEPSNSLEKKCYLSKYSWFCMVYCGCANVLENLRILKSLNWLIYIKTMKSHFKVSHFKQVVGLAMILCCNTGSVKCCQVYARLSLPSVPWAWMLTLVHWYSGTDDRFDDMVTITVKLLLCKL